MKLRGAWDDVEGLEDSFLYNGKELNTDFGLDWYAYGFRMYDASIGRFPSVDPIADQFAFVSPFNSAENSPIRHIDLWGLQKILPDGSQGAYSNEYVDKKEAEAKFKKFQKYTVEHEIVRNSELNEALMLTGDLVGFTLEIFGAAESGSQVLKGIQKTGTVATTLANYSDDAFRTFNEPTETFYRTMSEADYSTLQKTGKVPATSETFISPTRSFSESYEGILVKFELNGGTTNALKNIGKRDNSILTGLYMEICH